MVKFGVCLINYIKCANPEFNEFFFIGVSSCDMAYHHMNPNDGIAAKIMRSANMFYVTI